MKHTKPQSQPKTMTPTPPPAPVGLDALAADLEANGFSIPFLGRGMFEVEDQGRFMLTVFDYPRGDGLMLSIVDRVRVTPRFFDAIDVIRRHTQPTEGA